MGSGQKAGKLRVVDEELELALLPGEELLFAGLPNAKLSQQLMVAATAAVAFSCVGLVFLPIIWWVCSVYAKNHRYWVTNNRVIIANKIIGYNVRSIPLERISDIAVRATLSQRLFGLASIVVRDMTGEAQGGAAMLAVDNAAEVQAQLLDYVRQVNRREATSGAASSGRGPYRAVESLGSQMQMLHLLERIEENTRRGPRIVTDEAAEQQAAVDEEAMASERGAHR